jgi:hypothetical protein
VEISLAVLDEALCVMESWADGRECRGVLFLETNDLSPVRREMLRRRVAEVRELLAEARDRLGLKASEAQASGDIWSRCCGIRDTLSELGARHMKAYGELTPGLAQYMNGLSARLTAAIDRLAGEAGRPQ